jgi:hypothetical protein
MDPNETKAELREVLGADKLREKEEGGKRFTTLEPVAESKLDEALEVVMRQGMQLGPDAPEYMTPSEFRAMQEEAEENGEDPIELMSGEDPATLVDGEILIESDWNDTGDYYTIDRDGMRDFLEGQKDDMIKEDPSITPDDFYQSIINSPHNG